jgi:hypothetical protein
MGKEQGAEVKGNRRSVRAIRINTGLLVIALAPMIFSLCTNIVTGGSFSDALNEENWWVYPFLVASCVICIISNYKEAEKAADDPAKISPVKLGEYATEALPAVAKAARRALGGLPVSSRVGNEFGYDSDEKYSNETPETLQTLVEDLFASTSDQSKHVSITAAWRLAALMDSDNVRLGLNSLVLTDDQLHQSRLKWLVRPSESSTHQSESLNVVQGRIGYLIREGGLRYLPPPPLCIDPCIAVALIVVKEGRHEYHSGCLVKPHDNDAEIIKQLYFPERNEGKVEGHSYEAASLDESLKGFKYRELGRLICLEWLHTNRRLAALQAELISHTMRHFLNDELSSILFDALSPGNQAYLAAGMLCASKWMSPSDWLHWTRTGRDLLYAPRLEAAKYASFAGAVGLALGIVVMGCWQIFAWVSFGWSWYFGSLHIFTTLPGWLKAFVLVIMIVFCIIGLMRFSPLDIAVAYIFVIGLLASILASPVVRVHEWIASWEASSTTVIGSVILTGLLIWLGIYYSDRAYEEQPVQLGNFARGRLSKIVRRSRFRPEHEPGHQEWCTIPDLSRTLRAIERTGNPTSDLA